MRHCKVLVVHLQGEGLNLLDVFSLASPKIKSLEGIRNEADTDNQVKAAVAIAREVGRDPEKEFSQNKRVKKFPQRLVDRRVNEVEVSFASFTNR